MMKSIFVNFVVLLVVISKHVICVKKNDTVLPTNKFSLQSNEDSFELSALKDSASKIPITEASIDANVMSTTYRSVRLNTSSNPAQERDTKLMNLLAARRSALHQDRFRTHRRIVTTGRTRLPIETTSKSPPDSRTTCVRNCTKNFTRRTTASCMRQCTSIQRHENTTSPTNPTSDEDKSQKDNNEILFTDESSHGFFVVAKDANDTMNHITELNKGVVPENTYKINPRRRMNSSLPVSEADSYLFFGRKIPSLRPSFLSISTVSDEHPKVLEVSVSQKPSTGRSKNSNKFNLRDRSFSPYTRKAGAGKVIPAIASLTEPQQEDIINSKSEQTVHGKNTSTEKESNIDFKEEIPSSTLKGTTILTSDITPSLLVEDKPLSTETTQLHVSTPLIISVPDEEEITKNPNTEYLTEGNEANEGISTEVAKLEATSHIFEDKTNLIIFVNKTMNVSTSPSLHTSSLPDSTTEVTTVLKTTIHTSIRSTVFPPISTNNPQETVNVRKADHFNGFVGQSSAATKTTSLFENVGTNSEGSLPTNRIAPDGREVTPDTRRLNIATYVLAGVGMLPVLIVILYLTKSVILKGYAKHDEDFDVCITDQQPISPVKKTEKYDDEYENEHYEQCSISSMDEFNRANLRLKSLLGEGNFGQVWKAEADDLSGHIGATRIVAVKTVRSGSSQEGLKEEATIMKKLGSHPNVVTLLGACIESEPHMLIMEFAMRGRLLSLLRAARSAKNILPASVPGGKSLAPLSPRTLAGFASDIAAGMEYIAGKRIVHRDLAARNILLDHNGICKICDFGMSIDLDVIRKKRDKQCTADLIRKNSSKFDKLKFELGERFINHWSHGFSAHNGKKANDSLGHRPALPIRWMAPESLQYNEFSTETDVWAFGIVLWEIATLGATPYSNLSGREVVRHVLQGTRPELPKDGRHGFFDLMSQCWHKIPEMRPTFREARSEISRCICKWMDDDAATSDYMDVSGFSEDLEHGMVYFNQRISEFECEI